jgi:Phage integrase family
VMRACGSRPEGVRLRAVMVVLWRTGLRISEALALPESDLDRRRGAVLVRRGKSGTHREVGMDRWAWEQLDPWLELRAGPARRGVLLRVARPDPRPAVRPSRNPFRPAPRRRGGRREAAVRASPAQARARGRDVARRDRAASDPAPARARRPSRHQHLSARDRQHRDHPRRLRALRTDDPRQPPTGARSLTRADPASRPAAGSPRPARPPGAGERDLASRLAASIPTATTRAPSPSLRTARPSA